jgi:hypothetical protein
MAPRNPRNAHRRLDGGQGLEEILSMRVGRTVTDDHTVSWDGNHWGVPREDVCDGVRRWNMESFAVGCFASRRIAIYSAAYDEHVAHSETFNTHLHSLTHALVRYNY